MTIETNAKGYSYILKNIFELWFFFNRIYSTRSILNVFSRPQSSWLTLILLIVLVPAAAKAELTASITIPTGYKTAIYPTQETLLRVRLANSETSDIANVALSFQLPSNGSNELELSSSASYRCENAQGPVSTTGTLSITNGLVQLASGTLPASSGNVDGFCDIDLPVTTLTDDTLLYTASLEEGAVTGTINGQPRANTGRVSQGLNVNTLAPLSVAESYSTSIVYQGDNPTLTIKVLNTNPVAVPFDLTDTFPNAWSLAVTPGASATCNNNGETPSITPLSSATSLSMQGYAPAKTSTIDGFCEYSVVLNAIGSTTATTITASNTITSNEIGLGATASISPASLRVDAALAVKFDYNIDYDGQMFAGENRSMVLTIANRSSNLDISNANYSIALAPKYNSYPYTDLRGFTLGSATPRAASCGDATVTATGSTVSLSGMDILNSTTCMVDLVYSGYTGEAETRSRVGAWYYTDTAITADQSGLYRTVSYTPSYFYIASPLKVEEQWNGATSAGANAVMATGTSSSLLVRLKNSSTAPLVVTDFTIPALDGLSTRTSGVGLNVTSVSDPVCGGTISGAASPTIDGFGMEITNNVTIPAASNGDDGVCVITVQFNASIPDASGTYTFNHAIQSGDVITEDGFIVSPYEASGVLTVIQPLQSEITFTNEGALDKLAPITSLTAGVIGKMWVTLKNVSTEDAISNVQLSLAPLLQSGSTTANNLVATAVDAQDCVGVATLEASTPATGFSISGVSLAPQSECDIQIKFKATPLAGYNSSTYSAIILNSGSSGANGVLSGQIDGVSISGAGATANLNIVDTIKLTLVQTPYYGDSNGVVPGNPIKYTLYIDNYDTSARAVSVYDAFPNGIYFLNGAILDTVNGSPTSIDFSPTGQGCGTVSTSSTSGNTDARISISSVEAAPSPGQFNRCALSYWAMLPSDAALVYPRNAYYDNKIEVGDVCSIGNVNAVELCNGGAASAYSASIKDATYNYTNYQNRDISGNYSLSSYYYNSASSPVYYGYGGVFRYRMYLYNRTFTDLTGASLQGNLPISTDTGSQLEIAYPPNFSTNCGSSISNTPRTGDTQLEITGLSIPARANTGTANAGICSIEFDVSGSNGLYRSTYQLNGAEGSLANGVAETYNFEINAGTFELRSALYGSLEHSYTQLVTGRRTTANLTIGNYSSGPASIADVVYDHDLKIGFKLADPSNIRTTCSGDVQVSTTRRTGQDQDSVLVAGIDLDRGQSCRVIYDVIADFDAAGVGINSYLKDSFEADALSAEGGAITAGSLSDSTNSSRGIRRIAAPEDNMLVAMTANPSTLTFPGQISRLTIELTAGAANVSQVKVPLWFTNDGTEGGTDTGIVLAPNPQAETTCTAGTISAAATSNNLVLTGASLNAGTTCTVKVNIVTAKLGGVTILLPSGAIETREGVTNLGAPTTSLAVGSNIGLVMSFTPDIVSVNQRSRLRYTFYNPSPLPVNSLSLDNRLPENLSIPAGANPISTCGGAVITATNGNQVTLSGGSIPATPEGNASTSCFAEIDVIPIAEAAYVNTVLAGEVSAVVAGFTSTNSTNATATLLSFQSLIAHVGLYDSVYKTNDFVDLSGWSAQPELVSKTAGSGVKLNVLVQNPSTLELSNLAFSLELPQGMTLVAAPSANSTCGGSVSVESYGNSINLRNGTLAPNASCEVSVNYVTGNTPGQLLTPTIAPGAIWTFQGLTNAEESSATLEVQQKPSIGLEFSPPVITPGETSILTIALGNPNSVPITTYYPYFYDYLPTGLILANPTNVALYSTCDQSRIYAPAGGYYVRFNYNSSIPPGGCTIGVEVSTSASGEYLNYVPAEALNTSAGKNTAPASATLFVSDLGYISGRVFYDNSSVTNGTFEQGTDTPIRGQSVSLFAGDNCTTNQLATATTSEQGVYLFPELQAGTYSVCQLATQPAHSMNGTVTAGVIISTNGSTGLAGTGANIESGGSQILGIVLNGGGASHEVSGSEGNNFSELVLSSISGTVFFDVNNNGIQNGTDEGISGQTIKLLAADGETQIATTATAQNGTYAFVDLVPGSYFIEQIDQAAGTSNGKTIVGTVINSGSGGSASDPTDPISKIGPIALPANASAVGFNFGEILNDRIVSGWVFLDRNNNGRKDGDESGISGQVITLEGNDTNGNAVTSNATSQSDGSYALVRLPEGSSYTLTQTGTQPDWTSNGQTVAGSTGGTPTDPSVTPSVISGIDLSGINTRSAENNFFEIPVAAPDLEVSIVASSTELNVGPSAGAYVIHPANIGDLATNSRISVTLTTPSGVIAASAVGANWSCTILGQVTTCTSDEQVDSASNATPISVIVDVDPTIDGSVVTTRVEVSGGGESSTFFGNNVATSVNSILGKGSLSGRIWRDINRNKSFDVGEPTLSGFMVRAYKEGVLIETVMTDGNGMYVFAELVPGNYRIQYFNSEGQRQHGEPISGGGVGNVTDNWLEVTVGAGTIIADQGFPVPVDPSGIIYDSATRLPIEGAKITLSGPVGFDARIHIVSGSDHYTTRADGFYQFWLYSTAPAGVYTLAVSELPQGYTQGESTQIPPCDNVPTVGVVPNPARVNADNSPPTGEIHDPSSCPSNSADWLKTDTTYYLSFNMTPSAMADLVNNHIPADPSASPTNVLIPEIEEDLIAILRDDLASTMRQQSRLISSFASRAASRLREHGTTNSCESDLENTKTIYFERDSAEIRFDQLEHVEELGQILKNCPELTIEVAGYADSVASEIYNLNLSEARANNIATALIGLGVNSDQLSLKGYGETNPVADNTTEEGQALNRRSEFISLADSRSDEQALCDDHDNKIRTINANVTDQGVNSQGSYFGETFDCETNSWRIVTGTYSYLNSEDKMTQGMLNVAVRNERIVDDALFGNFWGLYAADNSVTNRATGKITGFGLNGGLYGALRIQDTLFADYHLGASVGQHSFELEFDRTGGAIQTTGQYSYAALYAGAAISGEISTDNFFVSPRLGVDLAYSPGGAASVRASRDLLEETANINIGSVSGRSAFAEFQFKFSPQDNLIITITPKAFCDHSIGALVSTCGFGSNFNLAGTNSNGLKYEMQFNADVSSKQVAGAIGANYTLPLGSWSMSGDARYSSNGQLEVSQMFSLQY